MIATESASLLTHDDLEAAPASSINEPRTLHFQSYKRRFYILLGFSFFAMLQGAIWNTWGPVSDTAAKLFGWDNTTLALLPNWGPILFLVAFVPMVHLLLRFGLRVCAVHCSFLLMLGAGLRCIPADNKWTTVLAHACGVLCGYCGTLGMIAPTAITATWFRPDERTTATAVMTLSNNNVATGFSFLAAKLMVRDLNLSSNATESVSEMRGDMRTFLLMEFGLCAALFLAVLSYYPKKPPSPPSSSASLPRVEFAQGVKTLARQPSFWLVLLSYAISSGAMIAFVSVLDEVISAYDISQEKSDWLGFYSCLVGIPGGVAFSRLADWRKRWMKALLVVTVFGATLSYTWFSLICFGVLPASSACLYSAILLGGFFGNGSIPLFYELGCEISYPVSEVVVTGLMTASNNLCCGLFLVAVMIKSLGTAWVNPTVAVSFFVCVPMLVLMRSENRRQHVDSTAAEKETEEDVEDRSNEESMGVPVRTVFS